MYQFYINNVVLWERKLELENEGHKVNRIPPAVEDSIDQGPALLNTKPSIPAMKNLKKVFIRFFVV
jgi:hypothetical protein